MASTYSSNLGIELIGTGDQSGTWGSTTNTNLGTLIEQAISGYVTQAVTTGMDTTITIPNGSSGVARNMYIELTGSGGASTNLIVPANKKLYFIFNNTSSGQVTVKVSGQTGISVPNGKKMILVSNGTDIVTAENYVASLSSDNLTLTGTLAVGSTSTFTGAATFSAGTANQVQYLNASKVLTGSANLTFDGTTLTANALTLTNNPTLSGGTANGVLYLNGSKVATSGSALQFSGTKLSLSAAGGADFVGVFTNTTAATPYILRIQEPATPTSGYPLLDVVNNAGSTAYLRVDSGTGNVGIGTASPSYKLDVRGSGSIVSWSDGTTPGVLYSTGGYVGLTFPAQSGGFFINPTGNFCTISTSGIERVRIDSSGSLGLGVTPAAWSSGGQIQLLDNKAICSSGGYINLGANWYYSGTFRYIAASSTPASNYEQNLGAHRWFSAAAGTAGNNISFGDAKMTLDASGNLLLGGTTVLQSAILSAYGAIAARNSGVDGTYANAFVAQYSSNNNEHNVIQTSVSSSSTLSGFRFKASDGSGASTTTTVLDLTRGQTVFYTGGTERARITSSGVFQIANGGSIKLDTTASGNGNISFDGSTFTIVSNSSSAQLVFGTNSTDRAVFEPSGYRFGLGTSSVTSNGGSGSTVLHLHNASASEWSILHFTNGTTGSAAADGSIVGVIGTDGDFQIYNYENTALRFATNNGERGRFTAGGYFKASNAGTYGDPTGTYHEMRNAQSGSVITYFAHTHNSNPYGIPIEFTGAAPDNNTSYFVYCADNVTARCYIYSDGDLANHDGVYGTISDERLKQDIVDAGSQWDDLKSIRFRKYRMKTDVEANPDAPSMFGVVAQELAQVCPGLVDEHPNMKTVEVTDEEGNVTQTQEPDGTTTMTVKSSILLMKAAKALQEAMARIESLEADMAALKGAK